MSDEERLARVTLSVAGEPGDYRLLGLVEQLGAVEALRAIATPGQTELFRAVSSRLPQVDPHRALETAERVGVRFVTPADAEWPEQLADLAHAGLLHERGGVPIGLWVKGPMRLDELAGSVAVVGSRSATSYGEDVARDVAAELGLAGVPTVSGGAYGIDHAAHRGAASVRAPTVAVLACGPDRAYPLEHREMLAYLAREHAVVSEAPVGASPHRIRFLARNRLIAALTRGTLVVEAAYRSGALSTSHWAQRLNRVVMAVPGPVTSATSEGAHGLIRRGAATLVTRGAEVLELVGAAGEHLLTEPRGPENERDRLPVKARQVLDAVPVGRGATAESIAVVAGLDVVDVQRALTRLEAGGFVEHAPGGWVLTAAGRASPSRPAPVRGSR
ncbi:DNA-processing protein DprA [Nocardioides sp. TF02-7]|uniref:DNA-processing protein DprA n=1 Tax=Nocardioides sp. TF02-7 TaxID=2917724 RepID=UPI001F065125|nr:DNA-processing protein DprA [Nocardioides sp. TF02-7]UMG93022.1 DNA-processing protein DprA [Nocardioides sp. TF02-7]